MLWDYTWETIYHTMSIIEKRSICAFNLLDVKTFYPEKDLYKKDGSQAVKLALNRIATLLRADFFEAWILICLKFPYLTWHFQAFLPHFLIFLALLRQFNFHFGHDSALNCMN